MSAAIAETLWGFWNEAKRVHHCEPSLISVALCLSCLRRYSSRSSDRCPTTESNIARPEFSVHNHRRPLAAGSSWRKMKKSAQTTKSPAKHKLRKTDYPKPLQHAPMPLPGQDSFDFLTAETETQEEENA